MKKSRIIFICLLLILAIIPLAYLFGLTVQLGFFGAWTETPALAISDFTYQTADGETAVTLPYTFDKATSDETVVLTTEIEQDSRQRLYFKSVFAPLQVYANDVLVYDYGAPGSFASYLVDPPVKVAMIDLPDEEQITLRLQYTFPITRQGLTVEPLLMGTYPSVFTALLNQQQSFSYLFIFFLWFGLLILCIGIFVRVLLHQRNSFVWLGLLALCCGLWGLGEYDIAGLFIHNESMLYLMGFAGIFYLPVPVHFYFSSSVGYRNPKPIILCGIACLLLATVTAILQITSVLSFYNALPFFILLTSLSFFFSAGYTVYEWRAHGNQMAKQFILPWCIVIVSTIIEATRFLHEKDYAYGLYAQIGLLIFILINSIIGGVVVRKAIAMREENRRMEQECKIMELQVAEQQRYHHLLMETRQSLRQQRHDLRHQLKVVHGLAKEGNLDKLSNHLNALDCQIPQELQTYCENIAVNALVGHFAARAASMGITMTIHLVVPEPAEHISDSNLCVIFGNILENGVEACGRMVGGGKFISLSSHIRNGMLVITQKNSFEGPIRQKGDRFYSAKREEFGVGLSSVQAVAQKHGGNATFTPDGRVFQSAIYVRVCQ